MIYLNNTTDSQRIAVPLNTNNTEYVNFMPDEPENPSSGDYYTRSETDAKIQQAKTSTLNTVNNTLKDYATKRYVTDKLDGYATVEYVDNVLSGDVPTPDVSRLEDEIHAVGNRLDNDYYTKVEVDEIVSNIQVDGPSGDMSNYYTKDEVDSKDSGLRNSIYNTSAKVTTLEKKFDDYYTKGEVEEIVADITSPDGPSGDKWSYYTKYEVDEKDSILSARITANHDRITVLENQTGDGLAAQVTAIDDRVTAIEDQKDNYYTKTEVDDEFYDYYLEVQQIEEREKDYLTFDKLSALEWGIDWGHVSWVRDWDDFSMSLSDFFKIFKRTKTGKGTIIACNNGWKSSIILRADVVDGYGGEKYYTYSTIMGDGYIEGGTLQNFTYLQFDLIVAEDGTYIGSVNDNGDGYRIYPSYQTISGSGVGSSLDVDFLNVDGTTYLNGYTYITGELNFQSNDFQDISYGEACDAKMQKLQATNLFTKNIWTAIPVEGEEDPSITFGTHGYGDDSVGNDDKRLLAKIDYQGNIYEGNTKLSEKYVLKSDYDALLARIEALEGK